jgi:hypothetical protein
MDLAAFRHFRRVGVFGGFPPRRSEGEAGKSKVKFPLIMRGKTLQTLQTLLSD